MEQLSIATRPRRLSEVIGQPPLVKGLTNRAKKNEWPRAMLFEGPSGTGKTSIAQIVAMTINCTAKVDHDPCGKCASCRSIIEERFDGGTLMLNGRASSKDEVVDFVAMSQISNMYSKNSIFIIEEADGLSPQAKTSMLKALESPKKNVYFLLLSMAHNGMGKPVERRCQKFQVQSLSIKDVMLGIRNAMIQQKVWDLPEIPKTFYSEVIPAIASYAQGSLGVALPIIENCLYAETYTAAEVRESLKLLGQEEVFTVLRYALEVNKQFFLELENLDLDEFFNISYAGLAGGLSFKITGQSKSDYFQAQQEFIADHPNSLDLLKTYDAIFSSGAYLKKPLFVSKMVQYFFSKKAPRKVED